MTKKFAFTSDAFLQARFRNVQRGVCEIELLTVYSYTRPRNALLYMLRKIQGSFLTVILDTEMGEAIYKFL